MIRRALKQSGLVLCLLAICSLAAAGGPPKAWKMYGIADMKADAVQGNAQKPASQPKVSGTPVSVRDWWLRPIQFDLMINISNLPIETVASLFNKEGFPLNGPLTMSGELRGQTGNTKDALYSLTGTLNASMGPGRLKEVGIVGNLFAKLFSVTSISSLFSGRLPKILSTRGIHFVSITARSRFEKGVLELEAFHFLSDAMTIEGKGSVDLVHRDLDIRAYLVPLATVDKALRFIPIAGKLARRVTTIRIDIHGPLENPKIRTSKIKRIGKGILERIKNPKKLFKRGN